MNTRTALALTLLVQACIVGEKRTTVVGPTGDTGPTGAAADVSRIEALEQQLATVSASLKTHEYTLVHNTELAVDRPVGIQIGGAVVTRTRLVEGDGPGPAVRVLRVREISATQLGLLAELAPPQGAVTVVRSANQTIATDAGTAVPWEAASYEEPGAITWSSDAASRLTFGAAGRVSVGYDVFFAPSAGGIRQVFVGLNGATGQRYGGEASPGGLDIGMSTSIELSVEPNDFVELIAYQNSGSDVLIAGGNRPKLQARYVAAANTESARVTLLYVP